MIKNINNIKNLIKELKNKILSSLDLLNILFFATGCAVFFNNFIYINIIYLIFFAILSVLSFLFTKLYYKKKNIFFSIIFFISIGYLLSAFKTNLMEHHTINLFGTRYVTGTVEKIIEKSKYNFAILGNVKIERKDFNGKVKILLNQELYTGDNIGTFVLFFKSKKQYFPGERNFKLSNYFNKIGGFGKVIDEIKIFNRGKHTQSQKINNYFEKNLLTRTDAIVSAIITGNKNKISNNDKQLLANSGVSHLLAISGMHMGFLILGIFIFFRLFFIFIFKEDVNKWPVKKISFSFGILFGFIYLYIADFPITALRTFIMALIFYFAILFNKRALTIRNVTLAGFLILIFYPEYIVNVSFLLSFTASIAIVCFFQYEKDIFTLSNVNLLYKTYYFFKNIFITSVLATLSTFPIIAYYFGSIPLYGIFANIIAIPLMMLIILPLSFVITVFYFFEYNNTYLNYLLNKSIDFFFKFIENVTNYDYSTFYIAKSESIYLAISIFSLFFIIIVFKKIKLALLIAIFVYLTGSISNNKYNLFIKNQKIAIINNDTIYTNSSNSKKFIKYIYHNRGKKMNIKKFKDIDNCNNDYCSFKIKNKKLIIIFNGVNLFKDNNLCKTNDVIILQTKEYYACDKIINKKNKINKNIGFLANIK